MSKLFLFLAAVAFVCYVNAEGNTETEVKTQEVEAPEEPSVTDTETSTETVNVENENPGPDGEHFESHSEQKTFSMVNGEVLEDKTVLRDVKGTNGTVTEKTETIEN